MIKLSSKRTVFIFTLLVLVIGIMSLLLTEGFFMKKEYLKPWDKSYHTNFADPRIQIISHGILAGSGHNLQNWKFVLSKEDPMTLDLYIDTERLAIEVDPLFTQSMISQGTMYEYMEIAASKLGYSLDLTFVPDIDILKSDTKEDIDNKRVAKITLIKTDPLESSLYNEMFRPDTNRLKFKKGYISEEIIKEFGDINTNEDLSISYIGPDGANYEKLNNYIRDSVDVETKVDRIMEESRLLFRRNEVEKNKYRYGFSFEGVSMNAFNKHFLQSLMTLFPSLNNLDSARDNFIKQTKIATENNAGYILILANQDTRYDEFNVGRLYSRIQLISHTHNLAVQPLSQPIEEYPEMKTIYDSIHLDFAENNKKILMIFRIGEPVNEASYSMRKEVLDFIK